jgi:hypothetical protein
MKNYGSTWIRKAYIILTVADKGDFRKGLNDQRCMAYCYALWPSSGSWSLDRMSTEPMRCQNAGLEKWKYSRTADKKKLNTNRSNEPAHIFYQM